jgi:hypothetical protein
MGIVLDRGFDAGGNCCCGGGDMSETALCLTSWKICIDRLDVPDRLDMIESVLSRPIEVPGLREWLRSQYIELTNGEINERQN